MSAAHPQAARRELRLAVALCTGGSLLVLLAASRTWVRYVVEQPAPLPSSTEHLTGGLLVPGLRPLALVALAGVAALFAARRNGRVLVGVLTALAGAGLVALDIRLLGDRAGAVLRAGAPHRVATYAPAPSGQLGAWPWVCLAGGLAVAAAGLLVTVRGRRWTALSASYDAPAARPAEPVATDKGVWDALDRGEDPTG